MIGIYSSIINQSVSSFPANGITGPGPAPGSSVDNAVVRWDGNTGTVIQNSLVTIDDTGHMALVAGTVAAPSWYLGTDSNTGPYQVGDGDIAWTANGGKVFEFGINSFNFYDSLAVANVFTLGPLASGVDFKLPNTTGHNYFNFYNQKTDETGRIKLLNGSFNWELQLAGTGAGDDQGYFAIAGGLAGTGPFQITYNGSVLLGQPLIDAKPNVVTVFGRAQTNNIGGTTTASAATSITGSSTKFLQKLGLGDRISLSSASSTFATVKTITSATALTVDAVLGDGSSQTINRKWALQRWDDGSSVPVMLLNDQGRLLIGNVSNVGGPTATLHIDQGNATASQIRFTAGTTSGTTSTDGFEIGVTTAAVAELRQRENLALNFYTNNTLGLQLDAGGTLGNSFQQYLVAMTTYTPSGTTQTLDFNVGNIITLNCGSASGNLTASFSNPKITSYEIIVTQGATARTVTWPTIKWVVGVAPTLSGANATDRVFLTYDGATYWGSYLLNHA